MGDKRIFYRGNCIQICVLCSLFSCRYVRLFILVY